MPKTKLLLFTDWFPPAYRAGGPIQSTANFVKNLATDYQIYVITSNEDLGGIVLDALTPNQWIVYEGIAKIIYLPQATQTLNRIKTEINHIQADFIYLNSLYSVNFSIYPLLLQWRKAITGKIILAPRGMLQAGALQQKKFKKKLFIRSLKLFGVYQQVHFHATDPQESADIQRHIGTDLTNITIIPNFSAVPAKDSTPLKKSVNKLKLVFISRIAQKKNLLFLLQILSRLPKLESVELSIYGSPDELEYWEQCQQLIQRLPTYIQVQYQGTLPHHQVGAALKKHHFFILPTKGENFGHAIFEALAVGRPVIISDRTPWSNLSAQKAGFSIALDQPEKFVHTITQVALMQQTEYNKWCKGALEYAQNFVHSSHLVERYKTLFSKIEKHPTPKI